MMVWYYPYKLGGWEGFTQIIPHKGGLFAGDVFRQMIPWKELSLDLIRQGQLPLWNPYAFSGEPLLANIQATILHPLSLLFFLIPDFDLAWSWYIIAAPIIAIAGMYAWGRSLGWHKLASLVAGLAFAFSGHMLAWLEWGVVAHTAIWLPWTLYSLGRYWQTGRIWFLALLSLSLYATILGGYPQNAAYVLLISLFYFAFLLYQACFSSESIILPAELEIDKLKKTNGPWNEKSILKKIIFLFTIAIVTLTLTLPQLIPTAQLYQNSALRGEVSQDLFLRTQIHPFRLINFFSSEYFGNRIYHNYWADVYDEVDYPDAKIFVGAVAAVFVLISLVSRRKTGIEYFAISICLIGLGIAVSSPVSDLVGYLSIPMISTGVAAGSLFLTTFGLAVLAGAGVYRVLSMQVIRRDMLLVLTSLGFFGSSFIIVPEEFRFLALRNSVIPITLMITSFSLVCLYSRFFKLYAAKTLFHLIILLMILGELTIYSHQLLSFSPAKYSYPEHKVLQELESRAGHDRVTGFWDDRLPTNLPTAWRLYSAEGYNPLHPRWYQELASGQLFLGYPEEIARSDVDFYPDEVRGSRRFMSLTSTKYVVAQVSNPDNLWEEEPQKFDPDVFDLVWQEDSFKIYQFSDSIDRVALYNQYQVIADPKQRLDYLYSEEFDPATELILEQEIDLTPDPQSSGSARIAKYSPNHILVETEVDSGEMLLLLTDTYYPSWRAYVEGEEVEILRANHAFRAVVVPEGTNQVEFKISWP